MTTPEYTFTYEFFPVGQGLFGYGELSRGGMPPSFRWVYDCGTVSPQNLLDQALDRIIPEGRRERLDIVVVSHFDKDHISGLIKLIRRSQVGKLLLPYMPLAQRLLLAFSDGVDTQDDRFALYLDPVTFFFGIEGGEIEEIVLVPGTGDADSPPVDGGTDPLPEVGEALWPISLDDEIPPEGEQKAEIESWREAFAAIRYMRRGSRIRIANIWEFVPYNDAELSIRVTEKFRRCVDKQRNNLLGRSSTDQQRRDALRELRVLYDEVFGANAHYRNLVSLFLYARAVSGFRLVRWPLFVNFPYCFEWHRAWFSNGQRFGILYSGDGYLDTPVRLEKVRDFLGVARMPNLAVFQVMHHGAEANWHAGVAAALSPAFSVFSSDPQHGRLRHPHALVLRDFWTHCPVQVDRESGFGITGTFTKP